MKKIIIVDDDENICIILSKLLEEVGYQTEYTFSGKKGLQLINENKYDFLIVDYKLDDISGLEILESFNRYHPTKGSIMISGYADEKTKLKAEKFNTLLFDKPFNNYDLISTVNSLI
ncbi:MAG: response regulator [Candidatus Cloacimonadota bacterium]|nr:response regulator [Candidatus Cloacimonadota bacterium]